MEAPDGSGELHKHLIDIDADGQVHVHRFAPRQRSLQDIHIFLYDLANDAEEEFKGMVKARLARARSLAPLLIGEYEVPVLPLLNPETGMSHHIVRLIHSGYPNFMVDLLFRDCDYYFAGFRRATVEGGEEQWGEWFIYGDLIKEGTVPEFLHAVKMGLGSAHRSSEETKPGGITSMEDIFFKLSRFQDHVRIVNPGQRDYNVEGDEVDNDGEGDVVAPGLQDNCRQVRMNATVKAGLIKSVARVIVVFSEAVRLRSVYLDILRRLEGGGWLTAPSELSSRLWKLIRNWGQSSNHIQKMLNEGTLGLQKSLPQPDFAWFGFEMTLADLIGPDGEIMLCKREESSFISEEELQRLRGMHDVANVRDPGFPVEVDEEEIL